MITVVVIVIVVFVSCATLALPVFGGTLTLPPQEELQGNGLVLLSSRAFYKPDSSFGSGENELHIIDEIMNNSSMPRGSVEVVASFYDASRNLLGYQVTYTTDDNMATGEKAPFEIIIGGVYGNNLGAPVSQIRDISLSYPDIDRRLLLTWQWSMS